MINSSQLDKKCFFNQYLKVLFIANIVQNNLLEAKISLNGIFEAKLEDDDDIFNQHILKLLIEFDKKDFSQLLENVNNHILKQNQNSGILYTYLIKMKENTHICSKATIFNRSEHIESNQDVDNFNLEVFKIVQILEEQKGSLENNLDFLFFLSLLKIIIGFYNEALQNIDEYIESQQNENWKQYFWRGIVLFQLGDFDQAQKSFILSQTLSNKNDSKVSLQIVVSRVITLCYMKEFSRAKGILEQFSEFLENEDQIFEVFGDVFFMESNFKAAQEFYQKCAIEDHFSEEIFQKMLICSLRNLDLKKAKSMIKKWSEKNSRLKFDKYIIKGLLALTENNQFSAKKYFLKAEERVNEWSNISSFFNFVDLKIYKIGVKFLEKNFESALEDLFDVIRELNDKKQELILKKMGSNTLENHQNEGMGVDIERLEFCIEEMNFNKAICCLMTGKNKDFWELIYVIDPDFYQKLKKLENNELENSVACEPLKLNYFGRSTKIEKFSKYYETSLFGKQIQLFFSISLPEKDVLKPIIRFEHFLENEFHPKKFALPLKHELMRDRCVYVQIESNNKLRDKNNVELLKSIDYFSTKN